MVLFGIFGEFVMVFNIDVVFGFGGICGLFGLGFCVFCIVILLYSCGLLMVFDMFDYIL